MDVFGISRAGCRVFVAGSLAVAIFSGCESRFNDKQPENSIEGIGFDTPGFSRLNASQDLDQRIAAIEESTSRIQKIVRDFHRIQKAQSGRDSYTQLDFMFDLNEELNRAPAVKDGVKFVKYGRLELKFAGMTPECKIVETKLETFASENSPVADGLSYSVRTCKTKGNYRQVLSIISSATAISFNFDNDGLKEAFADLLIPQMKASTACKFQFNEKRELTNASCDNMVARLSVSERMVFQKFQYSSQADIRFLAEGTIYENDTPKFNLHFSIDNADKPSFRLEPVK